MWRRRNHFKQLSTFRYRLHTELSASSHCSSDSRGSSSTSTDHAPDPPTSFQSGLKRSTAFHTAELLQQQVRPNIFSETTNIFSRNGNNFSQ